MFKARSAIATLVADGGRDGATGERTLLIEAHPPLVLAQLALYRDGAPRAQAVVRAVLGLDLPVSATVVGVAGDVRVYRTGPEQYWVRAPDERTVAALSTALDPRDGAVTPLSSSRALVSIDGPSVRDVLAKGLAIDLDPSVFRVGQFAQTGLHHVGVLVERRAEQGFDLYLPRTFAVTLLEWLTDAALPFGYEMTIRA